MLVQIEIRCGNLLRGVARHEPGAVTIIMAGVLERITKSFACCEPQRYALRRARVSLTAMYEGARAMRIFWQRISGVWRGEERKPTSNQKRSCF